MSKIIFVNPPISLAERYSKLAGAGNTLAPLGLLYLASVARLRKFDVAIVEASNKLKFEDAVEEILLNQPDYVAITATTVSIFNAARLAKMVKEKKDNITIIIGGPHLTAVPEETMRRCPEFDIGIIGEGEETLIDLLTAIGNGSSLDKVAGIIFRDGGQIRITQQRQLIPELDVLPFPAWYLLPNFPKGYSPLASKFQRLPAAYILTSRGCPYKCIFCDTSVFRNKCRFFSVRYVIEMIRLLYFRYGVREISFEDDTLLLSKERLVDICENLLRENLSLSWSCNSRVDLVSLDILGLMKKAGCWQIGYGIESGVQDILDFSKKNITLQQIGNAIKLTHKAGILSKGFFILGFPTDTPDTIRQTINFAKKIKLDDVTVTLMTPFPGSELYKIARQYGKFDEDWKKMNMLEVIFVPKGLHEDKLQNYLRLFIKEFYLRPRIIFSYLLRIIRNPIYSGKIFKGFLATLKTVF